jgi:hypothetical protein
MGRSDRLADMNEVYVHTKTARKEQLAIRLRHIEEKFGGLTVRKKGRVCTQHGVSTDHLVDMDGPNIHCRQPRQWYTGAEDKLIVAYRRHMEQLTVLEDQIKALATQISNMCGHNENGSRNPFAKRGTHGRQHHAQAHAHRRVSRFKLDIPEFQGCFQPKEFLVTEKIGKINKKKVPKKAAEIRIQLVVEEEDRFIEEDYLLDWASPPTYDTYPDEEMSSIHQVDFLGVDAILSKTFNQSCDEICGVETTFLSKSEGVFVSSFGILMAYGKGKAQENHDKSTWQSGVWGFHDKHQGMSMMKSITFIMGCGLVVILRSGEWNELTGHPKDRGKDSSNSKANSLQPGEDDVDRNFSHSIYSIF